MESPSSATFTIGGQPYLTMPEAAHRLGASYDDVKNWVVSGKVPSVRLDGRWFVAVADVDRLARDGPPPTRKRGPRSREQHMAQLSEAQKLAWASNRGRKRPMTPE